MPNFIHGRNAIVEAARAGRVVRVYLAAGLGHDPRLEELARLARVEVVSSERLDSLAPGVNQGVAAALKPRRDCTLKELLATEPSLLVGLDSIMDPQTFGGSQLCHAFAEPGGHRRAREDTKVRQLEYGRTRKETRGHERTRQTAGSGP